MNKVVVSSMYRPRMSCPQLVQQLWDAVKVIRYHHQIPTFEKIAKYMSKMHSVNEEDVSRQLQNCVRDGLLHIKKTKTSKGAKLGTEQESYKLPEPEEAEEKMDAHDWYCFKCYDPGDVVPCQGCHRVCHMSCTTNIEDKYICTVCTSIDEDTSLAFLKSKKLNRVLSFVCKGLEDKYSALLNSNEFLKRSILIGSHGAQIDISTTKESWRIPFLVYKPIDLLTMKMSSKQRKYRNVAEFVAHAQSIVYSVVIFHGSLSELAVMSRQMLRECLSEIAQVQACPSCYESAVLKQNRNWFCKPCRPPHTLVFAGSPYMPAKVLQEKDGKYEVVFFGPNHTRATVDKNATLPITTPVGHLGKTAPSWTKAMDELARHQKLLGANLETSSDSSSDEKEMIRPVKESPVVPVNRPLPKPAAIKTDRFSSDEEDVKKEEIIAKRKRGRPPKSESSWTPPGGSVKRSLSNPKLSSVVYFSDNDEEEEDVVKASEVKTEGVKRKRGRPPKNPLATTPVKRGPGRPRRKKPDEDAMELDEEEDTVEEKTPVKKESVANLRSVTHTVETKQETRRAESPTTTVSTASSVKKNEEEIVSSSCMEPQFRSIGTQTNKKGNKDGFKDELEELKELHANCKKELDELKEAHIIEIAATKKKQWCYNCELEAIYHCCWNTAYCSTECQQIHWQREHKRVCRRKR